MSNDSNVEGTFEDPLKNYEPKSYVDPLEQAIADEPVASIPHQPHTSIHPDQSVAEAVKKLASQHVACLLVEEDGELVGIFTDREVLNRVALESGQASQSVRDVMTTDPVYVHADDPAAAALCVMAVSGYRHVPVVDSGGVLQGIISPQRITGFLLKHFEKNR